MMARRVKAFGAFAYDFVIGDDWLIALGVVVTLALTYALAQSGRHGFWWLIFIGPVGLLPLSLWRAIRKR